MMAPTVESLIFSRAREQREDHLRVEGQWPDGLWGTYYLNGPGNFQTGSITRRHWLDGDGLVRRLHLEKGKVSFCSRYVRTERFKRETEAGKALYRSFGNAFAGDQLKNGLALESPANVSIYPFADRLLAFGEQSLPWLLDPEGLQTKCEWDFEGQLPKRTPFSAHPKVDPHRQTYANFGLRFLGGLARLTYFEFDHRLQLNIQKTISLKKPHIIHDFALSERFACFHLSPYYLDIRGFLKERKSLLDALSWHPEEAGRLLLLCRETGSIAAEVPLPGDQFSLHSINAFDQGDQVTVDLVTTDTPFYDQYRADPLMFSKIHEGRVTRLILKPSGNELLEVENHPLNFHLDFPSMEPSAQTRPTGNFWGLAMGAHPEPAPKFYNRLLRFDCSQRKVGDSYQTEPGWFLGGEPVFLPGPDTTGTGWVMTQLFCPGKRASAYALFDGFDLGSGPRVTIHLPHFDPPGFHACFLPH